MKVNGTEVVREAREALALLENDDEIAFDLETSGLSPFKDKIAVISLYGDKTGQLAVLHTRGKMPPGVKELFEDRTKRFTSHNGVSFDIPFLMNAKIDPTRARHFDTLVGAGTVITSNRNREVKTLQAEVNRRLGTTISKNADHQSWMAKDLDDDNILYCAEDMLHLHALRRAQEEKAREQHQEKALELEMAIVGSVARMTFNGLPLHLPTLDDFKATAQQYLDQTRPALDATFGPVNLGSHTQVKTLLEGLGMKLPLIFDPATKKKKPSTRAELLQAITGKGIAGLILNGYITQRKEVRGMTRPDGPKDELIQEAENPDQFTARAELVLDTLEKIVRIREASKLINMYDDDWLRQHRTDDGRVHARFRQSGTDTLRFSAHDPNLQQWPKDLRPVIGGEEGMDIVSCDYGQIEVVIAAEMAKDSDLLRIIDSGEDIHIMVASYALQKNPGAVTAEERRIFKSANFCLIFGGSPETFMNYALSYGATLTLRQAEQISDLYFRRFPGLARMKAEAFQIAKDRSHGVVEVRLRSGGVRHLVGATLKGTSIINTNVQGNAASGMKYAILECTRAGLHKLLGATVHDELVGVVQRRWSQEYARELEKAMLKGMARIVNSKVKVESKVSPFWS